MADEEKDTDSKEIQPSDKGHVLSPFEEMGHWFDDDFFIQVG